MEAVAEEDAVEEEEEDPTLDSREEGEEEEVEGLGEVVVVAEANRELERTSILLPNEPMTGVLRKRSSRK